MEAQVRLDDELHALRLHAAETVGHRRGERCVMGAGGGGYLSVLRGGGQCLRVAAKSAH